MCCFVAFLADEGLAPQTGKGYLAAVRSMQILLGLPDFRDQSSLPMLKRVQAGIQQARALSGSASRTRLPITAAVLGRIGAQLESSSHPHKELMWAVACTAFFGFFRMGELLPESATVDQSSPVIVWSDVAVDSHESPAMVRIHLRRSKCDQFGKGVDIVLGRTGHSLCSVTAIMRYISVRGSGQGIFFQLPQARVVTKAWFVDQLRSVLVSLGLPKELYAGHSFRIGAATTAAMAGVEDATIQILGRLQSAAYLQYVRMPSEQLARLSAVLARSTT